MGPLTLFRSLKYYIADCSDAYFYWYRKCSDFYKMLFSRLVFIDRVLLGVSGFGSLIFSCYIEWLLLNLQGLDFFRFVVIPLLYYYIVGRNLTFGLSVDELPLLSPGMGNYVIVWCIILFTFWITCTWMLFMSERDLSRSESRWAGDISSMDRVLCY